MGQGKSVQAPQGPPTAIDIRDFLSKNNDTLSKFLSEMKHRGFVVFELSDQHHQIVQDYLAAGKKFFALPAESISTLAEIDDLAGKKNKGYVNVAGVKEFLKLKQSDAKQLPQPILGAVPELTSRFEALNDMFLSLATVGVDAIGSHQPDSNSPYMDKKLKDAVMERIPQRSSISFIHYVPRDEPSKRADPTEVSSAIDEDGLNVPSKVHTDTGIMTFILCNDVPGLLVENRAKSGDDDAWFPVETMFSAYKYLFCILGNKTELFALKPEFAFKPTIHKVAIPYGVERHSLLYFVDVPQ